MGSLKETTTQRKRRLEKARKRYAEKRAAEDEETRRARLEKRRRYLSRETAEQRNRRLERDRLRRSQARAQKKAEETPEKRQKRNESKRVRMRQIRGAIRADVETFQKANNTFTDRTYVKQNAITMKEEQDNDEMGIDQNYINVFNNIQYLVSDFEVIQRKIKVEFESDLQNVCTTNSPGDRNELDDSVNVSSFQTSLDGYYDSAATANFILPDSGPIENMCDIKIEHFTE